MQPYCKKLSAPLENISEMGHTTSPMQCDNEALAGKPSLAEPRSRNRTKTVANEKHKSLLGAKLTLARNFTSMQHVDFKDKLHKRFQRYRPRADEPHVRTLKKASTPSNEAWWSL
eukprot:705230-Amphidinium_carterae.1